MRRGVGRFWASVIVAVIILWYVFFGIGQLADEGYLSGLVGSLVGSIPFGNTIGKVSVQFLSRLTGAAISTQKYISGGDSANKTVLQFAKDFCRMCLNSMAFAALVAVADNLIGAANLKKGYGWLTKVVWHLLASVLCTLFVNVILNFAFTQLQQIQGVPAGVQSAVITLLATGGGLAVAILLAKTVTALVVAACFTKVILLNIANLVVTQAALVMILVALSEKLYLKMAALMGGWIVVMIILVGIGMALDTVISPSK